MSARRVTVVAILAGSLSVVMAHGECKAASPKEECIDAHSHGQDMRERGQLSRARQLFMACAQNACPLLIQGDCARFGEELDHLLPSVSFAARDAHAADLPNTSVYVDDVLVATRLDDGKAYDLDPGKHTIRFVHDGREMTLRAILNQGEKGRALLATFVDFAPPESARAVVAPESKRPLLPLVFAGVGAAALGTGGVLLALGLRKVPDACSVSSKECAAAPGDPAFDGARSGASLANIGIGVGIGGAALLASGLFWYALQPKTPPDMRAGRLLQPWLGRGSGGVALFSRF